MPQLSNSSQRSTASGPFGHFHVAPANSPESSIILFQPPNSPAAGLGGAGSPSPLGRVQGQGRGGSTERSASSGKASTMARSSSGYTSAAILALQRNSSTGDGRPSLQPILTRVHSTSITTGVHLDPADVGEQLSVGQYACGDAIALSGLLYLPLAAAFFRMITCTPLASVGAAEGAGVHAGGSFLSSDPDTRCWGGEHGAAVPAVVAFAIIYLLGIPALHVAVLWRGLRSGEIFGVAHVQRWGRMYGRFDPEHCYWELVVLTRKLLLAAACVCLDDRRAELVVASGLRQSLGAGAVLALALILHVYTRAFKDSAHDALEAVLLWAAWLQAGVGILTSPAVSLGGLGGAEAAWLVLLAGASGASALTLTRDLRIIGFLGASMHPSRINPGRVSGEVN